MTEAVVVVETILQTLKQDLNKRMQGTADVLQKELAGLRTGRASVSFLEPVVVDAYGAQMPLAQVATISAPEPRLLTVQVWDRGLTKAVEKAIQEAGLGLNPVTEGQVLRIPIPTLTQERRQELTKVAHRYAEEARVAIRNVRRHGMDELKKAEKEHQLSEDEHRDYGKQVQTMTDAFIKKIDTMLEHKQKEIMQV
jgi:ribosome recycling factor